MLPFLTLLVQSRLALLMAQKRPFPSSVSEEALFYILRFETNFGLRLHPFSLDIHYCRKNSSAKVHTEGQSECCPFFAGACLDSSFDTPRQSHRYRKACMYVGAQTIALWCVPSRRLTDRIRELCGQAASGSDANFAVILSELQIVLHDHAVRTRKMAIKQIAGPQVERRLRKVSEKLCETIVTSQQL